MQEFLQCSRGCNANPGSWIPMHACITALSVRSQRDCEVCFSCIDFGGLNLPSRPRIVPVPAIPSAGRGFYAFNAAGFLPFFWSSLSNFGLFSFTLLLLECLLVILKNYKRCNKKVFLPRQTSYYSPIHHSGPCLFSCRSHS